MNFKKSYLLFVLFLSQFSFSQEGLPVYSDYLSDNYYLLHPSMAGIANCAKLRLTGRQQWFGQTDAPALQTLSFNSKLGESEGIGLILFNDKNGYHSQKGAKIGYAHHIMFSRDVIDLNQLSFGIRAGLIQSQLDESTFFINNPTFDPAVFGQIQSASYFNLDLGMSYSYLEFYTHFTVKNALASERKLYTAKEPTDLRKLIINSGYTFGDSESIMWEPSIMYQYTTQTKENAIDLNLKLYKELDFGKVWGGVSYRRSLDGTQYNDNGTLATQKLQYITPIVGINFGAFMAAYTYSYLPGNINFDNSGMHQITLGANLFCRPEKYHCNCPANN
jgi:type IX secretion system PorP/SprF family membrane protein